jgi:hypothetical protein
MPVHWVTSADLLPPYTASLPESFGRLACHLFKEATEVILNQGVKSQCRQAEVQSQRSLNFMGSFHKNMSHAIIYIIERKGIFVI